VSPIIWGIVVAAAAATAWHAVTEHQVHRRLLRRFRPGTVVPETTHDTWWHSLPKSYRVTVQAALMAAGLAAGIAYETIPAVATGVLAGLVTAGMALLAIRTGNTMLGRAQASTRHIRARQEPAAEVRLILTERAELNRMADKVMIAVAAALAGKTPEAAIGGVRGAWHTLARLVPERCARDAAAAATLQAARAQPENQKAIHELSRALDRMAEADSCFAEQLRVLWPLASAELSVRDTR
jgi:hypothetical protein